MAPVNMIKQIKNIEDVKTFTRFLISEGTNVHPDDDFADYVNDAYQPAYSQAEADLRNKLMHESFTICEAAGADIYDIMQEEYLIATGLSQFIPLPSSLNENTNPDG